jgi:hypothetical protein
MRPHPATPGYRKPSATMWVIQCSEGHTSSLAAATLRDQEPAPGANVVGGYQALAVWRHPRARHPRRPLLPCTDAAERLWNTCRHLLTGRSGVVTMDQLNRNRRLCCGD